MLTQRGCFTSAAPQQALHGREQILANDRLGEDRKVAKAAISERARTRHDRTGHSGGFKLKKYGRRGLAGQVQIDDRQLRATGSHLIERIGDRHADSGDAEAAISKKLFQLGRLSRIILDHQNARACKLSIAHGGAFPNFDTHDVQTRWQLCEVRDDSVMRATEPAPGHKPLPWDWPGGKAPLAFVR
jgi:hypothetical protein